MKKTTALVLALAASTAFAAPEDVSIANWDVDQDGPLSRAEAAAIQYDSFDYFDLNEDGDLKGSEREGFEAHLAFGQSQNPLIGTVGAPDANGDGIISAGEFRTWTSRVFDRMDVSGDGLLSESELMAQKP